MPYKSRQVASLQPRRPVSAKPVSSTTVLAWFASVVAAITTLLLLVGCGVALAAESALALPHSALFQSPQELLDLTCPLQPYH
jgi:hypothetical protein